MKTKKAKQPPKHIYRTIHLWVGLFSGIIMFVVALTGACYVFEEEGRSSLQSWFYNTPVPYEHTLSLDELKGLVLRQFPDEKITSIRFNGGSNAAYIFYSKKRLISVNPATGKILGVIHPDRDFFTVVEKIHTELYLGKAGEMIVKWNVLLFFILCITGFILWFPRKRKYAKQAFRIHFKTSSKKRLIWELHNGLGFYALPVLLLIVYTGLFFAYDTVKSMASFIAVGNMTIKNDRPKVSPAYGTGINLEQSYRRALTFQSEQPVKTIITLPTKENTVLRMSIRYPYQIMRHQNNFYFNANNGALISKKLFTEYDQYDQIAMSNYNLHTAHITPFSIGFKLIYFIVALIAASLPVTGFLIWRNKRKKHTRTRILYKE